MSYTKQTWADGDIITANKLNHIEDGIASAGGGITIANILVTSMTTGRCEYTYEELSEKVNNGETVLFELIGYLSGPAVVEQLSEDDEPKIIAVGVGTLNSQVMGFTIEYVSEGLTITLGE